MGRGTFAEAVIAGAGRSADAEAAGAAVADAEAAATAIGIVFASGFGSNVVRLPPRKVTVVRKSS